jgi:hypothetical protein
MMMSLMSMLNHVTLHAQMKQHRGALMTNGGVVGHLGPRASLTCDQQSRNEHAENDPLASHAVWNPYYPQL